MKRANTFSFVLFVIVVLGTLFWLLQQHGRTNWGLVSVLTGVLLLRAGLFIVNLRQQRHNVERGRGPVRIETRLGLTDELGDRSASQADASPSGPSQRQMQEQAMGEYQQRQASSLPERPRDPNDEQGSSQP